MSVNSAILRHEKDNSEVLIEQLRTKLSNNSDSMDKNLTQIGLLKSKMKENSSILNNEKEGSEIKIDLLKQKLIENAAIL